MTLALLTFLLVLAVVAVLFVIFLPGEAPAVGSCVRASLLPLPGRAAKKAIMLLRRMGVVQPQAWSGSRGLRYEPRPRLNAGSPCVGPESVFSLRIGGRLPARGSGTWRGK